MLDFVPNHTAPDHPWVKTYPDYYIVRGEADLAREPQNYRRMNLADGRPVVMAYGRNLPLLDGWSDTLQLNYGNPGAARGDEPGAVENRRTMRRRALRYGNAGAARRL